MNYILVSSLLNIHERSLEEKSNMWADFTWKWFDGFARSTLDPWTMDQVSVWVSVCGRESSRAHVNPECDQISHDWTKTWTSSLWQYFEFKHPSTSRMRRFTPWSKLPSKLSYAPVWTRLCIMFSWESTDQLFIFGETDAKRCHLVCFRCSCRSIKCKDVKDLRFGAHGTWVHLDDASLCFFDQSRPSRD